MCSITLRTAPPWRPQVGCGDFIWVINPVCLVSINYVLNGNNRDHVSALNESENMTSYLNFSPKLQRPVISFCQRRRWFLKKYFTNVLRKEDKVNLFRGAKVPGQQVCSPPQFSATVLSTHIFEEFREPQKWMCIQLCLHIKGQAKKKKPTKNKTNQ